MQSDTFDKVCSAVATKQVHVSEHAYDEARLSTTVCRSPIRRDPGGPSHLPSDRIQTPSTRSKS